RLGGDCRLGGDDRRPVAVGDPRRGQRGMKKDAKYIAPLARARGLGSARHGSGSWVALRVGALALIPLSLWLVGGLVGLVGEDHVAVRDWIGRPHVGILLSLTLLATFHHAALGV